MTFLRQFFREYEIIFYANIFALFFSVVYFFSLDMPVLFGLNHDLANGMMLMIYNFAQGIILSTIFFIIVTYLPERNKQKQVEKISEPYFRLIHQSADLLLYRMIDISNDRREQEGVNLINKYQNWNIEDLSEERLKEVLKYVKANDEYGELLLIGTRDSTIMETIFFNIRMADFYFNEIFKFRYMSPEIDNYFILFSSLSFYKNFKNNFYSRFINRNNDEVLERFSLVFYEYYRFCYTLKKKY